MTSRYIATYAYNGYLRGAYAESIPRIRGTATEMRREGIDIEFLGATQRIDGDGQLIEVTARYEAPSKGTVGRLNCRACLPTSGSPRPVARTEREPERRRVAVTARS